MDGDDGAPSPRLEGRSWQVQSLNHEGPHPPEKQVVPEFVTEQSWKYAS